MTKQITFYYQNKNHTATYVLSTERFPFFIFVSLLDIELIKKFGEDLAIKSDGRKLLGESDIPAGMLELKKILFTAIDEVERFNYVPMPALEDWQKLPEKNQHSE